MNLADLQAEYTELKAQLVLINTQIKAVIQRTVTKYGYNNVESGHTAEVQDLDKLLATKKSILSQITDIERQLSNPFVKIKNYN